MPRREVRQEVLGRRDVRRPSGLRLVDGEARGLARVTVLFELGVTPLEPLGLLDAHPRREHEPGPTVERRIVTGRNQERAGLLHSERPAEPRGLRRQEHEPAEVVLDETPPAAICIVSA